MGGTPRHSGIQDIRLLLTDHRGALADQRRHRSQLVVLLETFPECLRVRRALLFGLQEEPGELACLGERWGCRRWWTCRGRAMGMNPLGDQRPCAWKALLPDLAPQAGLIRTPLGQTSL